MSNQQVIASDVPGRKRPHLLRGAIVEMFAAFRVSGEPYLKSTAAFSYDDAGHVVDFSAPDFEITYDYSCWLPQDAGMNQ